MDAKKAEPATLKLYFEFHLRHSCSAVALYANGCHRGPIVCLVLTGWHTRLGLKVQVCRVGYRRIDSRLSILSRYGRKQGNGGTQTLGN